MSDRFVGDWLEVKVRRVVFLRHGESQYNVLKKFAGWLDCDLTPIGIRQAREAGRMLQEQGYSFDMAFSSELRRARDTRHFLLDEMGLGDIPTFKSWRLNERHYGAFDDLTREEAELLFGKETMRLSREDFRFCPPASTRCEPLYFGEQPPAESAPKSESMNDATGRCLEYWQNSVVPAVRDGKRVLVVAHGEILRLLTGHLLGMSEDEIVHAPVLRNATPLILDFTDDFTVSDHRVLTDSTEPTPLIKVV